MNKLISSPSRFYIIMFVVAGLTGFGTRQATALEAEPVYDKSCWYDVGTTPRCQDCYGSCTPGYVCCRIDVQPSLQ
ncbi:MAG TPA: hypothetical protein VGC13_14490 [Longimicrobium sp.]|jgi:hypothetical protein|uniref:hypothetical protein n=1 Tax=Longimicrobium sp. TaxID=2029185 RepID=UPI002ED8924C